MVSTYTESEIHLIIFSTPPVLNYVSQNKTSLQSYDIMLNTMSSTVPGKKWIHSRGQN